MNECPATTQTPDASGAPCAAARARSRASGRFYVCVALLLVAAVSMQGLASYFEVTFKKLAVPLKRPLVELDTSKLAPEYRLNAIQPAPIDHEMLANLGTEEYLQWNLDDQTVDRSDRTRRARLFITYYTDKADPVPHNPKECYSAGGAALRNETRVTVEMPGLDGETVRIPISVLEFDPPASADLTVRASGDALVVAYFFYANNKYVTSRTAVRTAVANLADKYAYHCKIEMTFSGANARGVLANREQTIAASEKLVRKIMPILWRDHFQDWTALKEGAEPVVSAH